MVSVKNCFIPFLRKIPFHFYGLPCMLSHSNVFPRRCSLRTISMMPSIAVTCTAWAPARPMYRTEQGTRTKRTPTSSRDMAPVLFFWVQHAPLLRHWSQAVDANHGRPTHFAACHRLFSPHTPVNIMAHRCPHTCFCLLACVRVWVNPFISTVIVAVWLDHFHLSWLWRWGFSFPKKMFCRRCFAL